MSLIHMIKSVLWSGLLAAAIGLTAAGFAAGQPIATFNVVYFSLLVTLLILERVIPFEPSWLNADGQTVPNILHTLSSKATVQVLLVVSGTLGAIAWVKSGAVPTAGVWPEEWPLWCQVALGVLAAEFMLYWCHRLAHENARLWRFHAIHHSVTRLWVINTGRFHFVDSVFKVSMAAGLLAALSAPRVVLEWVAVITAYVGLLTHCNVDMHCGALSRIFSTPNAHRWHHSRIPAEGNRNYGENLLLWDLVFGTWFLPKGRRPPANIGIDEAMPATFSGQLAFPFLRPAAPAAVEPTPSRPSRDGDRTIYFE
jgi:sterol desaturase/sphingolipid hydroxylase (fatty acid hydroxylase superfamily)